MEGDKQQHALEASFSKYIENTTSFNQHQTQSTPISSNASTPTNLDQTEMNGMHSFDSKSEKVSSPIDILPKSNSENRISAAKRDVTDTEENIDEYDEISFPDISASSMSTPTPPDEYVVKLQEAEVMIEKLRNTNQHHRTEVEISI